MKFAASASSISSIAPIVLIAVFFLLAACEDITVPHPFALDQVPPDVKAEPRLVTVPPALEDNTPWPLVGNVPFKPNDFSPKPAYNHYMNELEFDRAEAGATKEQAIENNPAAPDAVQQNAGPVLAPPQLPQTPSLPKE